jgi:hypothetical protein
VSFTTAALILAFVALRSELILHRTIRLVCSVYIACVKLCISILDWFLKRCRGHRVKDDAKSTLRNQQIHLDLFNEHFHPPPTLPGHLHGGKELTPGELLKVWEQAFNRGELRLRQYPCP